MKRKILLRYQEYEERHNCRDQQVEQVYIDEVSNVLDLDKSH